MSKISLKPALCAVFFSLTALVLSVCILEPVTINEYVEDDKVQVVIKRDAGRVNIITKDNCDFSDYWSDSGLTAGNGRILGLKNDKYYIIEEYVMEEGKNGELETTQFVKSDGTRSLNPTNIGKVRSGTITGLTNDRWYLVKSAEPLPLDKYDFNTIPATPATTPISIKDGEITLPAGNYSLTLNSAFNGYSYVKIPISSSTQRDSGTVSGNITLEAEGTVTDYIFFNLDQLDFYVLKVTIKPDESVTPGEITVTTVTFNLPSDQGTVLSLGNFEISHAKLLADNNNTHTFEVTLPAGFSSPQILVGTHTVTSNSITIGYGKTPDIDHLLYQGSEFTITIVVTYGGNKYSNVIKVTIGI
ncbi:MAG: hypothetical protein LBQ82_02515 [Treponema sp.]|nr:hypothetical protein [Treponema sp.]